MSAADAGSAPAHSSARQARRMDRPCRLRRTSVMEGFLVEGEVRRALQEYEIRGLDVTSRSEEHTSELQSLMRISYAVFCLKKKTKQTRLYYISIHTQ